MFELNNYLTDLPQDYKSDHAFKDWLHDEADMDTMRGIVRSVEKRIRSNVGQCDACLPHIDEKNWNVLKTLIKVRQTTLDEMMIPTADEVERMDRLNDKLLDLNHQLYTKVAELWKVMNDSGLHLDDDYCVEGAIKYLWDEDRPALKLDNDGWYASDFNYMLWVLSEFDQRDTHTMNSIHEILQDFSMTEDETRKELIDTYDDGDTWTDGALNRPAFMDINVCYVLHALCCHFHYSLADVLRMNGISLAVHVAYEHIYK
jgi:hypothetical protein